MAVIDEYELSDRYRRDEGRVFLSGSQALARLPYEQLRADRRAGLDTAAYVTGYPGSPLGNYDRDVAAAASLAAADGLRIVAQPALNEELAATAVMGSQLAATLGSFRHDGVVGIWYGKTPGVDRASDALRHAVFAGTSARGGAVALAGDDPTAKSSTLPTASFGTLIELRMPVLHPGDVQEAIDLGRHAIALSRATGLWSAVKVVDIVADGTGSIELHPDRIQPIIPTWEVDGRTWVPRPSGRLLTPDTLDVERTFDEVRLPLARRYAVLNHLNRVAVRGPGDWIGLVASGHTYHETVEALRLLGLRTDDDLRASGVRLFQLGMPWPLDADQVREFAEGLAEIVVVEDKQPVVELLVKDALFARTIHPTVLGKRTPDGAPFLPSAGALDADTIAAALRPRLAQRLAHRLAPEPAPRRTLIPLSVTRTPYFCSGCPHNTSTQVPEGALIGAGIGCHSMVLMMDEARVGDIVGVTSMGNEGAQWFGMAPFVDEHHLVQNIGDGTLFHSGLTAIRAAIANGVDITYKVLYNGTVAMTGGQDPVGQLDVPSLVRVLLAEGVAQVLITTDDRSRYTGVDLPAGVKVWSRNRIVEAQETLAQVPGCTVLIHDQRCAAERRRDRKRGRASTPNFRVVIDERVCEGCGDCGDASNCLSVQPVDTPFGRKTRIDQGSCNYDLSCMQGDCPAFMKVSAPPRRRTTDTPAAPGDLPDPPPAGTDDRTIRFTGIGGTGVVTVSQILGTAAMLDGWFVRGLDQTGLSQKAGPVISDLRLSRQAPHSSNRATGGSVDVLVAFDQLVAGGDTSLRSASADRTVMVVNTAAVPTGAMVSKPTIAYPSEQVDGRLAASARSIVRVDASSLVRRTFGDDSTVNVFMLGVAVQSGLIPVDHRSIDRAIELNGVAVEKNRAAFQWGRAWVVHPDDTVPSSSAPTGASVAMLHDDLVGYQSSRYAGRFLDVVERVDRLGRPELTDAVARHIHKLMAYKDEYEVARLLLLPESRARAEAVGGPRARVSWSLHPPVLRALGRRRKVQFGRWSRPLMGALRAGRRVRGTWFDPFRFGEVRRVERAMVPEYIAAVDRLLESLATDTDDARVREAVAIASLPDRVRGYEQLKVERATAYRAELQQRVDAFVNR